MASSFRIRYPSERQLFAVRPREQPGNVPGNSNNGQGGTLLLGLGPMSCLPTDEGVLLEITGGALLKGLSWQQIHDRLSRLHHRPRVASQVLYIRASGGLYNLNELEPRLPTTYLGRQASLGDECAVVL